MTQITAAMVKALRDATQLPMMECKKALAANDGDVEAAKVMLREQGKKFMGARQDRSTEEGLICAAADVTKKTGAMIELQCESAPVAVNEEFVQLAKDLATQLAEGPGANTPEELWAQPSPSKSGMTLSEQKDEIENKIREVFRLARILRVEHPCGAYVHHDGKSGTLLAVENGDAELAKEIAMHITAMKPKVINKDELDAAEVEKERSILVEAAKTEGKPENIIEKMVDGRMKNYFAECVLTEQPFVKDDKQSVGQIAASKNMKLLCFKRWTLGETSKKEESCCCS